MLWFTNLGVADPYFLIPLAAAATQILGIEVGGDGIAKAQLGKLVWLFRGLICFSLVVTANFEAVC